MTRLQSLSFAVVLGGIGVSGTGCGKAEAQSREAEDSKRRDVRLTIYKNDFALISETRPLQLAAGGNTVRLEDVSKSLDPQSVMLDWEGDGSNLPQLVSHTYDLGIGDGSALLSKYVGRNVDIVRHGTNGRESERETGRLLSADGQTVMQIGDRFVVSPEGTFEAPVDSQVVTLPQLSLEVESPTAQSASLQVAYLSRSISWSADYVATLNDDDRIALDCWATVTNKTGADFKKAQVVLMAGEANRSVSEWAKNRVQRGEPFDYANAQVADYDGRDTPRPVATGDLQAYEVAKAADVIDSRMNRLLLMGSRSVKVARDYSAQLPTCHGYYGQIWRSPERRPIAMAISFLNSKGNGLGSAMPGGAMRLYTRDARGQLRYLGGSGIGDTPKDARIDATVSNAFDLYFNTKLVSEKRLDKKTVRRSYKVTVHNEKAKATTVRLVERFGSAWKMHEENIPREQLNAMTVQWKVNVPAGGQKDLTFTVDVKE